MRSTFCASAILSLGCACAAHAGFIPQFEIEFHAGGNPLFTGQPPGQGSGNGNFTFQGAWGGSGPHQLTYVVEANPGNGDGPGVRGSQLAFINASVDVTNNSAVTQHYTIFATLPVAAPIVPAIMGGSAQGGLTAGAMSATLSSVAGSSIYNGMIDMSLVSGAELFPHMTSVSAGPFGSGSLGSASFGDPIPSDPAPDVFTSIGIRFDFSLDAGATATLSGIFAVNIPTPASAAIFAMAGVFASRRRRA